MPYYLDIRHIFSMWYRFYVSMVQLLLILILILRIHLLNMRKIIVVDDNEDILEIIKLILEGYDYEVVTLADGSLLFDSIREFKPDLILLDIMLGNMDGRELCKSIRENDATKDIPIIFVSASHGISDRFMTMDSNIDFLAKPFDINELIDKVAMSLSAA